MEAPDKIYVNFPFGEKQPWCGPMVTKQGLNGHDTIYIRKDTLLKWAREKYNEYKQIDEDFQGDVFIGNRQAFAEIIAKIESLGQKKKH